MKHLIGLALLVILALKSFQANGAQFRDGRLTNEGEFFEMALTLVDKLDRKDRVGRFRSVGRGGRYQDRIANWNFVLTGQDEPTRSYTWAMGEVRDILRSRNLPNPDLQRLLEKARSVVTGRRSTMAKYNDGSVGHSYAVGMWTEVVSALETKLRGRGQPV